MPAAAEVDPLAELASDIAGFTHDPLGHALYAYPWGQGELAATAGPRTWQRDVMEDIRRHLENPETRYQPCRISVASGHGIGKSALIGMLAKWGIDTCEDCKIVLTANTEPQLRTKTMPEISKWARLSITHDWFKITASALASTVPGHNQSWRLDAVTWSKENTEAFAGLHNQGKRIIVIYDEASGIDRKVWEVTLGALTDADTEIIWIAFGNPTQNTGSFRETFGKLRHLWKNRQIDSRTVEGTNRAYLDELVATYGEDSDIVRVRVRGHFPAASSMQFIGNGLVQEARQRELAPGLLSDPVIFGVDCARFGDDHSTLAIRCGRDARSRPWKRWHQLNSMILASDIVEQARIYHPDAIFIDAGNIGAAVADRVRQLMPDALVIDVWFGGAERVIELQSGLSARVANKRAEMWTKMRDWLPGGAIPDEQLIEDDLCGPEYGFNANQAILLEKKEHMKARGLSSPDDGDALACTFAEPVMPRRVPGYLNPEEYNSAAEYERY